MNNENELQIFNNPDFGDIRTMEIDGDPWFVGKDVAEALGYQNASKALADHVDEEDKLNNETLSSLGQRGGWLINESGLYSLALSSKLPGAKQFRRWITSDVIPSIRKHGAYMTPLTVERAVADPDFAIGLLQALKDEKAKSAELSVQNAQLTSENHIMKPKAEYFDELVDRNTLTGIRETAKEFGVPQNKFVSFLRDNGYVYRSSKKLMPYADAVNDGLFQLKERKSASNGWSGTQMFITPKGRETFRLLLKSSGAID